MDHLINVRGKSIFNRYVFILASILISVIFFLRGEWFGLNFNFSHLIIIIATVLFLSFIVRNIINGYIVLPNLPISLLTVFFILNPLFSILVFQQELYPSVLIIFELLLNIVLYYVFYIIVSRGYLQVKSIFITLILVSTMISIYMIIEVSGLDNFRRFVFFSTGANLLANSLSIVSFILLYWLFKRSSLKYIILKIIILSINLIALVLTGSRSGLIAFMIASIIFIIGINYKTNLRNTLIFFSFLFISIITMILFFDDSNSFHLLFSRFDLSNISLTETGRTSLWIQALSYVDSSNVFIGSPWLYEVYEIGSIHPHNFFISILVFTGLIPLVLMIISLLRSNINLLFLKEISVQNRLFYFLLLLIPILYASVSGHFTRIYTIFVILGIIDGIIWLNKNKKVEV